MTSEELFNWCCEQKCTKSYLGECDLCNYNKGRADTINECIENIIPTLYELDADQEIIDCVKNWLEQLKEGNK